MSLSLFRRAYKYFFEPIPPPPWHHPPPRHFVWYSKVVGAFVWFWFLYRAKQDGPVLLGLRHPWEGHDHDEDHEQAAESTLHSVHSFDRK